MRAGSEERGNGCGKEGMELGSWVDLSMPYHLVPRYGRRRYDTHLMALVRRRRDTWKEHRAITRRDAEGFG